MNIKRLHPNKKKAYVGRGGKRGKTSGRGMKGQKARAGHKIRPAMRDAIKKLPRLRGVTINKRGSMFTSVNSAPFIVKLSTLEKLNSGEKINPTVLLEKKIIRNIKGRIPKVKILDDGEISKKLDLSGILVSAGARKKIEGAGGTIN